MTAVSRVIPLRPAPESVATYLDTWLALKASLRPSTQVAYQIHVTKFLAPLLGGVSLAQLSTVDVEDTYRRILAGERGPVSVTTLHRIHATLMSALNTAVRRGLIGTNPAALVELPRRARHEMAIWTTTEARRFLTDATDDPWYLLYRLLLITGLRRGEALGLQWRDLTPDGTAFLIRRQLTLVAGRIALGEPKSSRGRRSVHLDEDTGLLLQAHRPGTTIPPGFVFCDEQGQPLDPALVSRQFTALSRRLGLPVIRLHDLRHTSASLGLEAGEPLTQVSRRLGHSTVAITGDIYTHISTHAAKAAVEHLVATIGG